MSERIDDDRVRRVLLPLSAGELPARSDVASIMPEDADRWLELEAANAELRAAAGQALAFIDTGRLFEAEAVLIAALEGADRG